MVEDWYAKPRSLDYTTLRVNATRDTLTRRLLPDSALVHQLDLFLDDFLAIFCMLHGLALQVEVFRIDRLFVDDLVQLRAQILHPIVPLSARTMIAHRFDVDDTADISRARAVILPADDLPFVVDDE